MKGLLGYEPATEICEPDMGPLSLVMAYMENMPSITGIEAVEFTVVLHGQVFRIGWGETGNVAVLLTRENTDG